MGKSSILGEIVQSNTKKWKICRHHKGTVNVFHLESECNQTLLIAFSVELICLETNYPKWNYFQPNSMLASKHTPTSK